MSWRAAWARCRPSVWARSNRRALSSAIDASWANRDSASSSRSLNGRLRSPDASPIMPSTSPSEVSGTAHTAPNVWASRPPRRARVGAVVVDVHRPARPDDRPADPGPVGQAVAVEPVEQADARRGTTSSWPPSLSSSRYRKPLLDADQARGALDDLPQQLRAARAARAGGASSGRSPRGTGRGSGRPCPGREAVGRLGEVQRPVGDRDEVVLLRRVVRVESPRPALTVTVGPICLRSAARPRPGPARSTSRTRAARDARQQDRELVAAVAVDAVPVADRAGHRGRDPRQQRVALGVPVRSRCRP